MTNNGAARGIALWTLAALSALFHGFQLRTAHKAAGKQIRGPVEIVAKFNSDAQSGKRHRASSAAPSPTLAIDRAKN